MKTKKEISKKSNGASKKKVVAKVRTLSAAKKVVKKTKTAVAPKRSIKKNKTIAAKKMLQTKTKASSLARQRRIVAYRLKRLTYMILSMVLGFLCAVFVFGLLEMVYVKNSIAAGDGLATHQFLGIEMFLPTVVCITIIVIGLGFGIRLGFWGWRVVYIEHNHRIFRKK